MIVVNILGGLGNQMFQYAYAKHLARLNNTVPILHPKTWYASDADLADREFELDVFEMPIRYATEWDVLRTRGTETFRVLRFVRRVLNRALQAVAPESEGLAWKGLIRETVHEFSPKFLELRGNYYLEGFWQSEKFFRAIEREVLEDFTFRNAPDEKNAALIARIRRENSVSLHIRRGDYLRIKAMQGSCDLDYYRRAVDFIAGRVERPSFYFFSDDIEWVKANLRIDYPCRYVDHNQGKASHNDLRLMIACKHNIIANSTFSWWGAWLNRKPGRIVVAPQVWFCDDGENPKDIVPESWNRL